MRIAVLGAGAVGLSVSARLSGVADVVAVTREHHATALHKEGFRMTRLDSAEEFDYVFVTAKSVDTATICREYAPILARSEVVSLQNGIGNEELIAGVT